MNAKQMGLSVVLAGFSALTAYAVYQVGFLGIFELVLAMLSRLRPQAFITTHFLAFAARLEREKKIPDLGFIQVHLDAERRASAAPESRSEAEAIGRQLQAVVRPSPQTLGR